MISHISGQLVQKELNSLVIDVNGVGYEILTTSRLIDSLSANSTIILYTHHHVREQSQELFGFDSIEAKDLFQKLITVNGVGPKAGLAIMNLGEEEEIRSAIASGDTSYINSASGVGKKGAEKVILELKDKVGGVIKSTTSLGTHEDDALEALLSLGYSKQQSVKALSKIDSDMAVENKIKLALKDL